MTQLFRPILDEEGNPTGDYEPVEDVFKEVVVEHPKYRKAVSDAYEKRQAIKALKQTVQEEESQEAVSQQEPASEEADPPQKETVAENPVIDPDTLYQQFKQRLLEETQAEEQARKAHQEMVIRIAKANNVNPAILRGSTEAELTQHAQQIATEQLKFRDLGASPDGQISIDDGFWTRIDSRLGWKSNN